MIKKIIKKVNIAHLEVTKALYPEGKKVPMKSDIGKGLNFWLDADTDNGFVLGFYEPEFVNQLREYLKKGSVFYDLGAHWGYFSLLASKIVGDKGKVYSFEPMPANFSKLKKNLSINKTENIHAFNIAVSNELKELKFSNTSDSFANTYIGNSESDNTIVVSANSLDNFVKDNSILPPDFLKIDVEGAELDVLIGASNTIDKFHPIIHLSTHDVHFQGVDKKCSDWLFKRGYTLNQFSSKKGIADYICKAS